MAIGRKSRVVELTIHNEENPKRPHKVLVQANKHHGICDIILCGVVSKTLSKPRRRLSELVSEFQGRQYDDQNNMDRLSEVLTQVLNPKEN